MEFKLNGQEYIQLNNLIKVLTWIESGGQANQVITQGMVTLNGAVVLEKRKKIRENDVIEFNGNSAKVIA
ncbi:MAG: ribosome-associated protein [Flavobacteriales bacterium]|jgi:ribosome-associated protein